MKSLSNRTVVLAAFGVFLFLSFMMRQELAPPDVSPNRQESAVSDTGGQTATEDSSKPAYPARQPSPEQGQTDGGGLPVASERPDTSAIPHYTVQDDRQADPEFDWGEVALLIRDHVETNHPHLKLSDADYERLADSVRMYREANLKVQSLKRTSENASAIRQAVEEREASAAQFEQVTGMSPDELFMDEEPPVRFGGEEPAGNDEIVTEYLSDHLP
jgi:hypothetical protein